MPILLASMVKTKSSTEFIVYDFFVSSNQIVTGNQVTASFLMFQNSTLYSRQYQLYDHLITLGKLFLCHFTWWMSLRCFVVFQLFDSLSWLSVSGTLCKGLIIARFPILFGPVALVSRNGQYLTVFSDFFRAAPNPFV